MFDLGYFIFTMKIKIDFNGHKCSLKGRFNRFYISLQSGVLCRRKTIDKSSGRGRLLTPKATKNPPFTVGCNVRPYLPLTTPR